MFDLKTIQDQDSAEVEVLHPITQEGLKAFVTLAGPEHPDRKAWEFGRQRRLRAELSRTGKVGVSDPEDDEADQIEVLVQCTLGWRGFAEAGADVPYSKDAARKLFEDKTYSWLRGQLMARLRNQDLFIRTSAPA